MRAFVAPADSGQALKFERVEGKTISPFKQSVLSNAASRSESVSASYGTCGVISVAAFSCSSRTGGDSGGAKTSHRVQLGKFRAADLVWSVGLLVLAIAAAASPASITLAMEYLMVAW